MAIKQLFLIKGTILTNKMKEVGDFYGGEEIEQYNGFGEFIGGETKAEGIKKFIKIIEEYEKSHSRRYRPVSGTGLWHLGRSEE